MYVRKRVVAVVLTAAALSCTGATAAHADEAGAYLGWTEQLGGDCTDKTLNVPDGAPINVAPEAHLSQLYATGTDSDDNGNIVGLHWVQNAVDGAVPFKGCDGYHFIRRWSPTGYVHRTVDQYAVCNGGGCALGPMIYGSWQPGSVFP
ncbi:hypothetical protein ACF09H_28645 [Streptomyces sp. NPDC014983]|uniref:hypothetical protein n=1 Tax=unclassified Streptomyces TaxID=2593676 RepID=UPI00331E5BDC